MEFVLFSVIMILIFGGLIFLQYKYLKDIPPNAELILQAWQMTDKKNADQKQSSEAVPVRLENSGSARSDLLFFK
ncbi:hypothetical protein [Desulfonema magnum]|nr:hypothetical protein [Desulfonema magnum]